MIDHGDGRRGEKRALERVLESTCKYGLYMRWAELREEKHILSFDGAGHGPFKECQILAAHGRLQSLSM